MTFLVLEALMTFLVLAALLSLMQAPVALVLHVNDCSTLLLMTFLVQIATQGPLEQAITAIMARISH